MSNHIEWVHATELPEVISPEYLAELADAGNDDQDWGVGAGEVMVYGTVAQLTAWLQVALNDLAEPMQAQLTADAEARRAAAGMQPCEHNWALCEDGYSRTWSTSIDEDSGVLTATFNGLDDFTQDGDGREYLRCLDCNLTRDLPDNYDVVYD